MNEASKAKARLLREGLFERYIVPPILDIGCGSDKITEDATPFDLADGDAQKLDNIEDESFSTVFSSHCLEHLRDPLEGLLNWWRVLKPGGHLIVLVPDEDLYEQGIWPSIFNPDHKWTFSVHKATGASWSPRHRNLIDLFRSIADCKVISARTIDTGYDYAQLGSGVDQTLGEAEAAIEVIATKVGSPTLLRSSLASLLLCPSCRQQRVTLLGNDGSAMHLRCESCGAYLKG
jgi:SAM-dependent methyltransferase